MEDKEMKFKEMLLKVQESLSQDEVLELVFLCTDLLRMDLSTVVTAGDLFLLLMKEDLLSPDDPSLLVELLTITKCYRLIRELNLCPEFMIKRISSYRKLLFDLAEDISKDDLKTIKFLLHQTLPPRTLEKDTTPLQLFLDLEKVDRLAANNLDTIQRIIKETHPYLQKKISQFKAMSVDNVEGRMSHLNLTENSNQGSSQAQSHCAEFTTAAEEKTLSCPDLKEHSTLKLEEYDMKGHWRGFCLIINNYNFSGSRISLGNRKGTDIDEKSLVAVFQWLGFKAEVVNDCSKQSMLDALENLRCRDHTEADCVVCCVLTHGCEGGVYGVDGEKVELRKLMEPLNGHYCQSLIAKPKLFFIQACQGTQEQQVVFLNSDGPDDSMEMGIVCDAQVPKESLPAGADFLLAKATVPNYVSYREVANGSWFIQSLCKNLRQLVPRHIDLLSILTGVNNDVSRRSSRNRKQKQIPQPEFTLRKRVVFPVPNIPPPD